MKTLIGIVTFGNLAFTKLAIRGIEETVRGNLCDSGEPDLFVVVGKPDDLETVEWLQAKNIRFLWHRDGNRGFPASLNDIYDYAWPSLAEQWNGMSVHSQRGWDYDNLILMGNDVVPYPRAILSMMEVAMTTPWEWICASQYDVKSLVRDHPEVRPLFTGHDFRFSDFSARPWAVHTDFREPAIHGNSMCDVRNLCLFKRSVAEKLGYADVNFWPGGYFEDNDYCLRAVQAGIRGCTLPHAAYFHFWSRTIHQAGGGSTTGGHFERNRQYYLLKWGGDPTREAYSRPFDGNYRHRPNAATRGDLLIDSRADETAVANYWKLQG